MADITMCDNQICHARDKCYRARAPVSDWQSWAIWEPRNDSHKIACDGYIELVPHTRKAERAKTW